MDATLQETTVVRYHGSRSDAMLFHGQGRAEFRSGSIYEGSWQHGRMHGPGRLQFPDGVQYEGDMVNNAIKGYGVYTWEGAIYEGQVVDGKRHGYGTMKFAGSPQVYQGNWQDGQRHGRGILYFNQDMTAYYDGDWENDLKQGQGTMVYPSGNSYIGSWHLDQKQGYGTMHWATKGQRYQGEWENNLPNGIGEHLWSGESNVFAAGHAMYLICNRYYGMFKDGKRHGEGTLFCSTGARYEGQWQADKKHGEGLFVFEDGSVFAGQFNEDRPVLETGAFITAAGSQPALEEAPVATMISSAPPPSSPSRPKPPSAQNTAVSPTKSRSGTPVLEGSSAAGALQSSQGKPTGSRGSTPQGSSSQNISSSQGSISTMLGVGGPGFGPRQSQLQVYIADLLQREASPANSAKQVANLLIGYNTELRLLYDKYCKAISPALPSSLGVDATGGGGRPSSALQAAQVWEMMRDARLINYHLTLAQLNQLIHVAVLPPPVVQERREKVSQTYAAAAVVQDSTALHHPACELLYRDFCELLVRLASQRYPQLPSLEQQLQQVLSQHLVPLVAGSASAARRASTTSTLVTGQAVGGIGGRENPGTVEEEVVKYLGQEVDRLQQLFELVAVLGSKQELKKEEDQQQHGKMDGEDGVLPGMSAEVGAPEGCTAEEINSACAAPADIVVRAMETAARLGVESSSSSRSPQAATAAEARDTLPWQAAAYGSCCCAQKVLAAWQQAQLLQGPLSSSSVGHAFLDGILATEDPHEPRLRLEATACPEENAEIACSGAIDQLTVDGNEQGGDQGAQAATEEGSATSNSTSSSSTAWVPDLEQGLLFWLDAPLTFIDFLWGLVECAKLLPAEGLLALRGSSGSQDIGGVPQATGADHGHGEQQQAVPVAQSAEEGLVHATTLEKLQELLAGRGGLYASLLGVGPEVFSAHEVVVNDKVAEEAEEPACGGVEEVTSEAELEVLEEEQNAAPS